MNILTVQEVRQCIDYVVEAMALIGITNEYLKNKEIQQKVYNVPAWNFDDEAQVSFERDSNWQWAFENRRPNPSFNITSKTQSIFKFNWDYKALLEVTAGLINDTVQCQLSLNNESNRIIFRKGVMSSVLFEYEMMDMTDPDTEMFLFQESLVQKVEVINALMFAFEWRRRKLPNIQIRLGADPLNNCEGILNIIKLLRDQHGFNGYTGYEQF